MRIILGFVVLGIAASMAGCYSSKPLDKAPAGGNESIAFNRPAEYTMWFGTRSKRVMFETVYERASLNDAQQYVVEVGIRYRGPQDWTNWNQTPAKTVAINAVCNFYREKGGPAVYSTNQTALVIKLGDTYAYKAVCPIPGVTSYQLVLSE